MCLDQWNDGKNHFDIITILILWHQDYRKEKEESKETVERVSTWVVVVVVQPVYLCLCACLKRNIARVTQIATWTLTCPFTQKSNLRKAFQWQTLQISLLWRHWSSSYARKTDNKDAFSGSGLIQSVPPLLSTILILDEMNYNLIQAYDVNLQRKV